MSTVLTVVLLLAIGTFLCGLGTGYGVRECNPTQRTAASECTDAIARVVWSESFDKDKHHFSYSVKDGLRYNMLSSSHPCEHHLKKHVSDTARRLQYESYDGDLNGGTSVCEIGGTCGDGSCHCGLNNFATCTNGVCKYSDSPPSSGCDAGVYCGRKSGGRMCNCNSQHHYCQSSSGNPDELYCCFGNAQDVENWRCGP